MRIALINKVFSHSHGGGERYAADLANELVSQDHSVTAFGNTLEDLSPAVETVHVKMFRKPGWLRLWSFNHNAVAALREHRQEYDVSYALTPVFPVDACFLGGGCNRHWLKLRFPSPWLQKLYPFISHNHIAQNWLENNLFRNGNTKLIITNSNLVKRQTEAYFGNCSPQVVAIHNGIDSTRFKPVESIEERHSLREKFGLTDTNLGVAYVSHNWQRKGLATVIRALGELSSACSQRYKLLVAGRGNPQEYQALAQQCGLDTAQLVFCGQLKNPELLYQACDLFILPTQYDPCASVVLEAMACGIPAISTRENGASELISEGINGFILNDYENHQQLAGFLEKMLNDELRQKMGLAALEGIMNQSFHNMVIRTVKVLEEYCHHD